MLNKRKPYGIISGMNTDGARYEQDGKRFRGDGTPLDEPQEDKGEESKTVQVESRQTPVKYINQPPQKRKKHKRAHDLETRFTRGE